MKQKFKRTCDVCECSFKFMESDIYTTSQEERESNYQKSRNTPDRYAGGKKSFFGDSTEKWYPQIVKDVFAVTYKAVKCKICGDEILLAEESRKFLKDEVEDSWECYDKPLRT